VPLLRYFRDLDTAEEALQEACLRALKSWPRNGPPRDRRRWLIMVAATRRSMRCAAAPADRIGRTRRRCPIWMTPKTKSSSGSTAAITADDVLRLLFICCHPDLRRRTSAARAADRLRTLGRADRARLRRRQAAMEQRITRAKARIAKGDVAFETPAPSSGQSASPPSRR